MEIKNSTMFFAGMVALVLGCLVMTFDLPQIQFLGGIEPGPGYRPQDGGADAIHQRLVIEFAVGGVILAAGAAVMVASFSGRFQN